MLLRLTTNIYQRPDPDNPDDTLSHYGGDLIEVDDREGARLLAADAAVEVDGDDDTPAPAQGHLDMLLGQLERMLAEQREQKAGNHHERVHELTEARVKAQRSLVRQAQARVAQPAQTRQQKAAETRRANAEAAAKVEAERAAAEQKAAADAAAAQSA